ncbi:alpha/beta fold hydrolase [Streptomyces sp. NPDC029003]|uniref:alpha/beta fold hydrolase n=1 Tax=Streptomyces sp. NPDC029003 TaxID=3155125 RepID=UPI0033F92746
MPAPPPPGPPGIRPVVLDAAGIPLSGLLALPAQPVPRAVVVALHGAGMSAGYFDSRARPGLSLLELGAALGYAVLALDRPGYGASAAALPEGQELAGQTETLLAALDGFARDHELGAGFFLVAHSNGGRLALSAAADADFAPVGLDLSGLGRRFAVEPGQLPGAAADLKGQWRRHWGALRFYPPDAFRLGQALVRPVPALEARETVRWPDMYPRFAARTRVPVRFTFAEQELWWRTDGAALEELLSPLPRGSAEAVRLPDSGHNISLGWAARTYHLRVLAFLEECLLARDAAAVRVGRPSDRDLKKVDADLT